MGRHGLRAKDLYQTTGGRQEPDLAQGHVPDGFYTIEGLTPQALRTEQRSDRPVEYPYRLPPARLADPRADTHWRRAMARR